MNENRRSMSCWRLMVADAATAHSQSRAIQAFDIADVMLDREDQEICIVIVFPDPPEDKVNPWSVDAFIDVFAPLASDYPNFRIVATVELTIEVDGMSYSRFDMPIEEVLCANQTQLVALVACGFEHLRPERGGRKTFE